MCPVGMAASLRDKDNGSKKEKRGQNSPLVLWFSTESRKDLSGIQEPGAG